MIIEREAFFVNAELIKYFFAFRVSSAKIRSLLFSVSIDLREISFKLPIGVQIR